MSVRIKYEKSISFSTYAGSSAHFEAHHSNLWKCLSRFEQLSNSNNFGFILSVYICVQYMFIIYWKFKSYSKCNVECDEHYHSFSHY